MSDTASSSDQESLVESIGVSILDQMQTTPFECGGSVTIVEDREAETETPDNTCLKPIQIRFGADGSGRVLTFPANDNDTAALAHLLNQCQPATFGWGSEDILDESYRKASKLDPIDFATTFCPYEAGIVDVVAQLLLPNVNQEYRGVRVELYKLNIYSAPSGKFKAHVDTPRSEAQFGSLVVCLPLEHEGGELVVRHGGKEMVFDWSVGGDGGGPEVVNTGRLTKKSNKKKCKVRNPAKRMPAMVKWAAFYSDCEHEVLEVTSGHRLTLTYNLYFSTGGGLLAGQPSALDPTQLSFYADLKAALGDAEFFEQGRMLGFALSHAYAHTSRYYQELLPFALKGSDMYLYEACQALGLASWRRPVMSIERSGGGSDHGIEDTFVGVRLHRFRASDGVGDEGCNIADDLREGDSNWPNIEIEGDQVWWINNRLRFPEVALGTVTYGNQANASVEYSSAAMFVYIPPVKDGVRMSGTVTDGDFERLVR